MKIWKQFNSSHSMDITIVGTFTTAESAEKAFDMIEDFTTAGWEEKYPTLEDFNKAWEGTFTSNIRYVGVLEEELDLGIDNAPDFERDGNVITISSIRNNNIGGVIKLMRFAGAGKIVIE